MRLLTSSINLACVLALAACRATPEPPPSDKPAVAETTANPRVPSDDNLNAVVWQQTSEEYRLVAIGVWQAASRQLDRAMKDPHWDALTREDRDAPADGLAPAVILDVDETVLDNSPYQARLIRDHKAFDEFSWANWAHEEAATAVPGALAFAKEATARGVTIYYLSNRAEDLSTSTYDNLKKLGFPITSREQFLGLGTILQGCEENGTEKSCRRRSIGRRNRVLLQVGDQIGDMTTVLANTPEGRRQSVEPYLRWVGERWFVLPNPTYGSWEPALFNNDWSQPAEQRREKKLDALRY
jgi:5'-nucleotidase (lipoprotein e(P4) family)